MNILSHLLYDSPCRSACFTGKLLPFQKDGVDFILKCEQTPQFGGCFLFDDMGLGKTGTSDSPSPLPPPIPPSDQERVPVCMYACRLSDAVMVLAALAAHPRWPTLVVAPGALVVENWRQEVCKWLGTKPSNVVACPSSKALQDFVNKNKCSLDKMHVVIITYDALPQPCILCLPFLHCMPEQLVTNHFFCFTSHLRSCTSQYGSESCGTRCRTSRTTRPAAFNMP